MQFGSMSRRAVLGAGLAVPAVLLARDQSLMAPVRMAAPMRRASFLDSLGANTHLRYAQSQYNAVDQVIAALHYCGIRHVRDTAISRSAPNADHYARLAQSGVRFCLFWGPGRSMAEAIGEVAALEAAHPGCVEFLEGPNEIQAHFAYAGQVGLAAGRQFMVDMKTAASASPALARKQLVSFTSYAPVASVADFANHHPYPKNGAQPGDLLRLRHEQWVGSGGAMPGKPRVLTEFGYHTLVGKPARPGHWQGVDEDTQAILILNGLFDAAALGIARTYLYQLFDGGADTPGHVTQENHFGLFRHDGQPKPAAGAIRALSKLLADSPTPAATPQPFPGHVSADRAVNALPLADGPGATWLALWQEAPIWNVPDSARTPMPSATVTFDFPRPTALSVYAPTKGTEPVQVLHDQSTHIMLGAEPLLVRIG